MIRTGIGILNFTPFLINKLHLRSELRIRFSEFFYHNPFKFKQQTLWKKFLYPAAFCPNQGGGRAIER